MNKSSSIIECKYNILNNNNNNDECIICFKTLHKKNIVEYSCGHTYHYTCLKKWLKQSGHVIDHCVLCDTVRSYTIIYKKTDKQKNKKCNYCIIQ